MEENLEKSLIVDYHENVLTRAFVESDSRKVPEVVKFYTGLPSYSHLKTLFEYGSSNLSENKCSALSLFQQFLIVLIADQDIAYLFGISQSVVSKNF